MYEGSNEITFSKETINRLFSKFMSGLFSSPIKVTNVESDYKGLTVNFTAEDAASEKAKQATEVDDKKLEETVED